MKKELSVYVLLFSFLIQILISCHKGPDTLPAGFTEPADPDSIPVEAWSAVKPGLQLSGQLTKDTAAVFLLKSAFLKHGKDQHGEVKGQISR
jgi:hypothetical protein